MELISTYKMREMICKMTGKFGVYVAGYQFDFESERWDIFIKAVRETFPEKQYLDIMSGVVNDDLILFDTGEDAIKLMKIMCNAYFYSNEYAAMYGPEGHITENT